MQRCLLYRVMRHVASTYGRSMTNGANYKRGKLRHSPWHCDICTSNQLNSPPGRLSRPFQTKTVNKREEEPIEHSGSPRKKGAQSIHLLSDDIPNAISISNSDTIPTTISESTEASSEPIPISDPETIPESKSNHSHRITLLQEGRHREWLCEAVSVHLSHRYLAQFDLSVSSHICSKIVLGCIVCNCSYAVDSVLDANNQ